MSVRALEAAAPARSTLWLRLARSRGLITAIVVFLALLLVVDAVNTAPLSYFDVSFLASGGASLAIAASLEPSLTELVKIRASQINGCANCINMHATEARSQGETEQRIYLLSAWREAPCYTERERAALGWTEALTRLCEGHTHESAYDALRAQFSD